MKLRQLLYPGTFFFTIAGILQGQTANTLAVKEGFSEAFSLKALLNYQVYGFTIEQLGWSLLIVIITMIFRNLIAAQIFKYLKGRTQKRDQTLRNDLIKKLEAPLSAFILLFGLFLAASALPMEEVTDRFIGSVYRASTMIVLAWGLMRFTDFSMDALKKTIKEKDPTVTGFMPLIKKSVKIFIVIVGALMVIDNLGYKVSGILATLGIGGAAIAFASQNTIANFFGSLCIVLDRPFKVGDWIQVGDKLNGDVISIGLRSTRIKTFFATVLSIPNSLLANEVINNWSRMPKRRVKQIIGVTYATEPETMNLIVEDIRQLLREDEKINQDFILVNFTDFGESSLDIMVYYFTKTTNWLEYLDARQAVNVKIMQAIAKRGSSIAFPSRTLYFANTEGGNSSSNPLLGKDDLAS